MKVHMIPTTMQALVFDQSGKPEEVVSVQNVAVPKAASGEVLLRVRASPIQPADSMFIGGRYRIKPVFPQIAGLEGCGEVVSVGEGVSIELGRLVSFRHAGAWAEFISVPLAKVNAVPAGIAAEQACQFSLNPVTACGLLDEAGLVSGDWFAINAATSGVARIMHGLAQRRGLNMLGIVRAGSATDLPFPKVSMDETDLSAAVLQATGGKPISALFDSVGGLAITRAFAAMKQGAHIVSYGVMEPLAAQVSNVDMIYRNLSWKGFGVDYWLARTGARFEVVAQDIWQAIGAGQLDLPVKSRHKLDDFKSALSNVGSAPNIGKVLLVM
jgi:NADPH:quinone reductase